MNLIERLIEELNAGLDRDPWHGPSLIDLLNNVNWESAIQKPIPNAHSIAELVLHIIAWTEEVARRLDGVDPSMPARGDWPEVAIKNETDWKETIKSLFNAQQLLIEKLNKFPEASLEKTIGDNRDEALGTGTTYQFMLHGLSQHNAYHGGQIALLSKYI